MALAVRDRRSLSDQTDLVASPQEADVLGKRAALGAHQKVSGMHTCVSESRRSDPQDYVVARMPVPGRQAICQEGVRARVGRDEPHALHADVAAVRQLRVCDELALSLRRDRKDLARGLAGRDEVTSEASERWRGNGDASLHSGRAAGRQPGQAGL